VKTSEVEKITENSPAFPSSICSSLAINGDPPFSGLIFKKLTLIYEVVVFVISTLGAGVGFPGTSASTN